MRSRWLPLLVLLAACAGPNAQEKRAAVLSASAASAERAGRVRTRLQGFVDRREASGFVWVVLKDGKRVHEGAVGSLDIEKSVPMRSDTIFRLASMTKPITSVAVMMLLEDGKVLLTDRLSKFIPAFKTMLVASPVPGAPPVAAEREITIRDLLTHRSGLVYGFEEGPLSEAYRRAEVSDGLAVVEGTMAENVARLATVPLASQPGREFHYSLSVDVLGRVVEIASGMPLDAFFRDRIFLPLGMKDTGFSVPVDKWARLATVYSPAEQGGLRPMKDPERFKGVVLSPVASYREPKKYFSGGAGLVSTADDYARFCQMLLDGGEANGVRLLSRKSVELMTSPHTRDLKPGSVDPGVDFGLGFSVVTDVGATEGLGSQGSYGWGGVYGTVFWVDPQEHLVAVLMAQRFPHKDAPWGEAFSTAVYQALAP